MAGKIFTIGLICFLLGTAAAMFFGPWLVPSSGHDLPPCPYLDKHGFAEVPSHIITAIGSYEAIRETLLRESLEGVAQQANLIARAFAEDDQRIASVAKRLAAEQDVESARRAFMRMHRLMQRQADKLSESL